LLDLLRFREITIFNNLAKSIHHKKT